MKKKFIQVPYSLGSFNIYRSYVIGDFPQRQRHLHSIHVEESLPSWWDANPTLYSDDIDE
jgi:hypothetical protein